MFDAKLFINGAHVDASGGATFERRNPLSGEIASRASAATPEDAVKAVEAAAAAFPSWSAMGPGARRTRLYNGLHLSFHGLRLLIPLGNTFC